MAGDVRLAENTDGGDAEPTEAEGTGAMEDGTEGDEERARERVGSAGA